MKQDRNTFKGLVFFAIRLLLVAFVASLLFLAYDLYEQKKVNDAVDNFLELLD